MTQELIIILREYLLSFDEESRKSTKKQISENEFEIISGIERAFLTDTHIDKIIKDFYLTQFQDEIRDIHAEFYLELAELYAEGKINKEIETLLSSDSQTFKKAVSLFPNETAFIKELSIAVDDAQTEKMIKGYAQIDNWFESKRNNQRAAANVVNIRKMIFKYAIAAALVGVLIGGFYLNFFNKEALIDNTVVAKIEMPNLIDSAKSKKLILVNNGGRGFAKNRSIFDSITIEQNGLSKQIDTLQSMLENLKIENKKIPDLIQSQIIRQIDSLQALLNTYTFNSSTKKAILNLPKVTVIENIISINRSNLSKFYIKIKGTFYLIETNAKPVKLVRVANISLVDSLKTIEFLNE